MKNIFSKLTNDSETATPEPVAAIGQQETALGDEEQRSSDAAADEDSGSTESIGLSNEGE